MKKLSAYTILSLLSISLLTFSCIDEHFFGKSSLKEIRYFTVPGQLGNTQIVEDSLLIRLSVGSRVDISQLAADSIGLSSYARVTPSVGEPQDFNQPVIYQVEAEDGSIVSYQVFISKQSENQQLENSGFDDWYTPEGKNYEEPGKDENTIWASGNAGVVTLGEANVERFEVAPGDFAARLITRDLGPLAQLVRQRMAAGSMFTGKFVLDISNPLDSPKFGIAFSGKPKSFTVSYSYSPGEVYRNGQGQILEKEDQADIYLLLENRSGSEVKRIGTGWLRSGEAISEFREVTVPIIYGTIPSDSPSYWFPANGQFGSENDEVTHLSLVFASSAEGANFEGGVNSTLIINSVQLNY
ncbi:PCMD domain-containing protein [uncultured Algoriphagus sp.]|uniref:PCMD domain-containing protein n=1 Tax=uncultured Algoriphagus sp. TaxID=417365 RepID=UPI002584CA7A|nr:PCMD domain-containing protein [uncultured Algoriphagus sp.]